MRAWVKYVFAGIISSFLIWYLVRNWGDLKNLLSLSFSKLALIFLISSLGMLISGMNTIVLLRSLGTRVRFWDMILLQNVVYLLNYVPLKFGTLFRANYLKRHYNLPYARFSIFMVYLTLIMTVTAPIAGIVVLSLLYPLRSWEVQVLMTSFISSFIVSFVLLFFPVPLPKGSNRFSLMLRDFLVGRAEVINNKKSLLYNVMLMNLNFILSSARLGIIYSSLGQQVHPAGFLILGAVGYFLMFISITPGSIGIREVVLGAASTVIGVPFKVGIPAVMIDRAIAMVYSFVIGGICTLYLWRKNPKDFKNN